MIKQTEHKKLADFMQKTAGIQLPPEKKYLIEGRLNKRKRELGFDNTADYLQFVLEDPEGFVEQQQLIDVLTTNKTNFFREKTHFELLQGNLLNNILAEKSKQSGRPTLRIWSAACSSGEEVYTLAMVMLEARERLRSFDVEILGSDICQQVLGRAASGVYTLDDIEPIPALYKRKYLLKHKSDPKRIKIGPELRQVVRFSHLNLLKDNFNFSESFDVIFCRNVMIYFNQADRNHLIAKFRRLLPPWGALFVGHSERIDEQPHKLNIIAPAAYVCVP